ncbi:MULTISPECIES: anthranilate synthase component I [Pelosinus]|uniref:Anthranilate synthase component 1 n=1 Tax=Pelosinus fermentans B4 TaxID=1149862 RepID=I9AVZ3_9FIRM|nr:MULTISPECIES: anthranilate synthase component I [Pelosinus]EIW17082.1 anthranilate synthase component I [Pelosinus fermentans B4]EIW23119.1 anthranilate synthase component I [Pelosinus fermentans A11]OAM93839.1 anthranilate synthase component I [Pelosinus fermentans DSM 17108]SDQ91856.1 anthranilate synthase component 1 [Pelosinus fermentans]
MEIIPSLADFSDLAKEHNLIPIFTDLSVDLDTPVSIYSKITGDNPGFILESADTSKAFGRYSFIGADPFITVFGRSKKTEVRKGQDVTTIDAPPLVALQRILGQFSFPNIPELPPFSGGAVGYFNYETVGTWEKIRGMNIPEDEILGEFMFCRIIIVMDHLTHSAKLLYLASIESGIDIPAEYEKAVGHLRGLINKIQQSVAIAQNTDRKSEAQATPAAADDEKIKQNYLAMVEKAKEYIAAGDIFQVVLSKPFYLKTAKTPFNLYRRLRQVNPSPYMFFINVGNRQIVGASPEMLVKLEGGHVFTCPIAGTRPRGKNQEEDEKLAAELIADEKERAEHYMLVDLGRNDVGRVSMPGTVKVKRMLEVEKFSHVMHLVSEVSGVLNPKYTPMDVLAACFPAGTLSGAPKVRAMEIIHELEQLPRGPYGGAVGYFDFRNNMDTCITIRTMVIDGDRVGIQTGAGIVADSVPEMEYQEILNKAKVLFKVIMEDENYDFNY